MQKGRKFLELFLLIGARILLALFAGEVLFIHYADAAEYPKRKSTYLETVLGASLGAGNYTTDGCHPDCGNHVNSGERWGVKAQLYTMEPREKYGVDLGIELGLSNTLNPHLGEQGNVNDRLAYFLLMARKPVIRKRNIDGSVNVYGGVGPGWVKTQFAVRDNEVETEHHGAFVALAGLEFLATRHTAFFAEFQHANLGNSTFEIPREHKNPRMLSLDRKINTVDIGMLLHFN